MGDFGDVTVMAVLALHYRDSFTAMVRTTAVMGTANIQNANSSA
jgi:hypothetical protein